MARGQRGGPASTASPCVIQAVSLRTDGVSIRERPCTKQCL